MNKTINAARAGVAILVALALSACATRLGRDFDDGYAQQIKPGQALVVKITYAPQQPGTNTGSLALTDSSGKRLTIPLSGSATASVSRVRMRTCSSWESCRRFRELSMRR